MASLSEVVRLYNDNDWHIHGIHHVHGNNGSKSQFSNRFRRPPNDASVRIKAMVRSTVSARSPTSSSGSLHRAHHSPFRSTSPTESAKSNVKCVLIECHCLLLCRSVRCCTTANRRISQIQLAPNKNVHRRQFDGPASPTEIEALVELFRRHLRTHALDKKRAGNVTAHLKTEDAGFGDMPPRARMDVSRVQHDGLHFSRYS